MVTLLNVSMHSYVRITQKQTFISTKKKHPLKKIFFSVHPSAPNNGFQTVKLSWVQYTRSQG